MKQRITVYFPDTAMVSFLREKPVPDPLLDNDVPNGTYHFTPEQVINAKFAYILHGTIEVSEMMKQHGKPSTLVVSKEDSGIIQMTEAEYEERFKDKEKDNRIAVLLGERTALEDDLQLALSETEAIARDAFERGFEEGADALR